MKNILMITLVASGLFGSLHTFAQEDKSKRPSPPATVSGTTASGDVVTIDYSQPSVKGRTIGKDIAPYDQVWRTGANEATVFEIVKDAKIQGKFPLPAGKYSLYTIPGEKMWTIIFNKNWKQWGTEYNQAEDALRVEVEGQKKAPEFKEKFTITISKEGKVSLLWGNKNIEFTVE